MCALFSPARTPSIYAHAYVTQLCVRHRRAHCAHLLFFLAFPSPVRPRGDIEIDTENSPEWMTVEISPPLSFCGIFAPFGYADQNAAVGRGIFCSPALNPFTHSYEMENWCRIVVAT